MNRPGLVSLLGDLLHNKIPNVPCISTVNISADLRKIWLITTDGWLHVFLETLGLVRGLSRVTLSSHVPWTTETKVARSNQQKHTFNTGSIGTFLLIAACHLSWVSLAQGTYGVRIELCQGYLL